METTKTKKGHERNIYNEDNIICEGTDKKRLNEPKTKLDDAM